MSWFLYSKLRAAGSRLPVGALPEDLRRVFEESLREVPEAETWDPQVDWVEKADEVVLISGGLDSYIAYMKLVSENIQEDMEPPLGLFVAFDTPYLTRELEAVKKLFENWVMLDLTSLPISERHLLWSHIIPFRNLICIQAGAELVSDGGRIVLAALSGELRGDKSLEFLIACEDYCRHSVDVWTPFDTKTKGDIVAMYIEGELGLLDSLLETVTCFNPLDTRAFNHCGRCRACLRKFMALQWGGFPYDALMGATRKFMHNPYRMAREDVDRYRKVMSDALLRGDFLTYSERRCVQDLTCMGWPNDDYIVIDPLHTEYEHYRKVLYQRIQGSQLGSESELDVEEA